MSLDHAVNRLTDAGLSDDSTSSDSDSSDSGSSGISNQTWAIIGGVAGGVVLLIILVVAFICVRRSRRRKAYSQVHRGVDDPNAPQAPNMSGGLMPLWMRRSKQEQQNNPSIVTTPPAAQTDDQQMLRRYSQSMLPPSNRSSFAQSRDVFNAEEGNNEPNENDRLAGDKYKEDEFSSAYDRVDTGYGTGYPASGDRRSNM